MKMNDNDRKGTFIWGCMLLLSAMLVSLPVLLPGTLLVGDDILFHLDRIEGIKNALLAGEFPVRVNAIWFQGYGMPSGIFYPNFFWYFPALLCAAGVSLITSWKIFVVVVNLVTAGVGWWAFSVALRSRRTGAIAALFYLVFLYRMMDLYARSAGGEMLAMAFLPGALFSVWFTLHRSSSYWPAVVFFTSCVLESHIITSLLLLLADFVMIAISFRRFVQMDIRWAAGKVVLFTVLLNLWFYAPLLYFHHFMDYGMKHMTHESIVDAIRPLSSMDFYMGSAMLLVLVGILLHCVVQWVRGHGRPLGALFWCALIVSFSLIWLTTWPMLWERLGEVAGVLQFPFRLGIFPAVLLPLVFAMGLKENQCRSIFLIWLFCLCGNLYWTAGNTYTSLLRDFKSPEDHIMAASMQQHPLFMMKVSAEYLQTIDPAHVIYYDYADWQIAEMFSGEAMRAKIADQSLHPDDRVEDVVRKGNRFFITYRDGIQENVQLPLFWYMGYTAEKKEGERVPVWRDEQGQVSTLLPSGAGTLCVRYTGLPWFALTDGLSLLGCFGFLCCAYRASRREVWG